MACPGSTSGSSSARAPETEQNRLEEGGGELPASQEPVRVSGAKKKGKTMKITRTEVVVETEQIVITRQSTPHELICPECGEKIVVEHGRARSGGFAKRGHRKPCRPGIGIELACLDSMDLKREKELYSS